MYILPKEHPFAGNVYMNGNAALSMTGNMNGLKLIFSKAQVVFSFFYPRINRTRLVINSVKLGANLFAGLNSLSIQFMSNYFDAAFLPKSR